MSQHKLLVPVLAISFLFGCGNTVDNGKAGANVGQQGQGDPNAASGTPGSSGSQVNTTPVSIDLNGAFGAAGASNAAGACKGLECQQKACAAGATTTISGRVFDPSGALPLYNVMVYVPNAPLTPLTPGATCACEVSGEPVASALTDTNGRFSVKNAPVGSNIPLVIQIGKWRRQFTIPAVADCAETAVPEATLRLPARQSEGDMPRIALTTGEADALECLVRKLGIDPAEFTNPTGTGRINYFGGHNGTNKYAPGVNGGVSFPRASSLWGKLETLKPYDVVLLSCEGGKYANQKGAQAFQAMQNYANLGGRVFASHWHEVWFTDGPAPFPTVAEFVSEPDIGTLTADVTTTFPKGQALAEWLVNVQASTTPGLIDLTAAQYTVKKENPMVAQRWISSQTPQSVQYLSANTPFGAAPDKQCGRVVLSDIHVAGGREQGDLSDSSGSDVPFPTGCRTTGLTPQEKVLAFMLFDITACVIPDNVRPEAPAVIIR